MARFVPYKDFRLIVDYCTDVTPQLPNCKPITDIQKKIDTIYVDYFIMQKNYDRNATQAHDGVFLNSTTFLSPIRVWLSADTSTIYETQISRFNYLKSNDKFLGSFLFSTTNFSMYRYDNEYFATFKK